VVARSDERARVTFAHARRLYPPASALSWALAFRSIEGWASFITHRPMSEWEASTERLLRMEHSCDAGQEYSDKKQDKKHKDSGFFQ